jgi:metal-responsive CopG/Arc/MetJ family transcriptional regulator
LGNVHLDATSGTGDPLPHGLAAVVISVTIKPDLLDRLDAWCASRLPPATRSAAIAAAVERLLAEVK